MFINPTATDVQVTLPTPPQVAQPGPSAPTASADAEGHEYVALTNSILENISALIQLLRTHEADNHASNSS